MTNTAAEKNPAAIGPLSLNLNQEVWVVLGDTPEKLYVINFPDWLDKYVLKKNLEAVCSPMFFPPEDLHLDEKSAWTAIKTSLLEESRRISEKLMRVSQHIANAGA